MKKSTKILLLFSLIAIMTAAVVISASAVGGAAFTTFNPSIDGETKDVCKNSIINCNIYGAKEFVWLNGGPDANHLKPDGYYFFTVLEPGGQPNPNDQGGVLDKNLSDDYDTYLNRVFRTEGGEVVEYIPNGELENDHWLDSGEGKACNLKGNGPDACKNVVPDGLPPLIRLFPYSDTTNPGGVYIMAICYLGEDFDPAEAPEGPGVEPRDCKYDAFKVKEGRVTYDFMLDGYKIHDRDADGDLNGLYDVGLADWEITITGTGFLGEEINETLTTDINGYWMYQSQEYTFQGQDKPQTAHLVVCEVLQDGWMQSYPTPSCYEFDIDPEGVTYLQGLNFGNYMPVDITVCKEIGNYSDSFTVPYEGWTVYLYQDGALFDTQLTGEDGCYTWEDLAPGYSYAVGEEDPVEWVPEDGAFFDFGDVLSGDGPFSHTFVNFPAQGCTPGFWQGGNGFETAGGQWLWNTDGAFTGSQSDPQWSGEGWNPYNHGDDFCSFFGCAPSPLFDTFNMFYYVDVQYAGNNTNFNKAARSLVAGYLNVSWGMNYAYTAEELESMWAAAYGNDTALGILHGLLDDANNHFDNPEGECPISANIP
jgi:hypothetical protein